MRAGLFGRGQDLLKECTIHAPSTGIVTDLTAKQGENVVIGTMNNPGTVIMVISDLSVIEVEAEVDETDVALVQVGQQVNVELDAFPDTTFKASSKKSATAPRSRASAARIRPPTSWCMCGCSTRWSTSSPA